MKEMGWDYQTYLNQPDELISLIEVIVVSNRKAEIKEAKKLERNARK